MGSIDLRTFHQIALQNFIIFRLIMVGFTINNPVPF